MTRPGTGAFAIAVRIVPAGVSSVPARPAWRASTIRMRRGYRDRIAPVAPAPM